MRSVPRALGALLAAVATFYFVFCAVLVDTPNRALYVGPYSGIVALRPARRSLHLEPLHLNSAGPAQVRYADDDDKCVLFHCGNWAKSFLPDIKIANAPILGSILGVENTYGALDGRTPAGPLTYGRITTADAEGRIRCYVGEGELTNDELKTFGNRAVAKVPNLQKVLHHVCEKGFEHHVVMTQSHSAANLAEAFGNYLGWEVHNHND